MRCPIICVLLSLSAELCAAGWFHSKPNSVSVPQYTYIDYLVWRNVPATCSVTDWCARSTCVMTWTWTGWGDSQLVYRCRYVTVYYQCAREVLCNSCWSDNGFLGRGTDIYASPCSSCRGPASWTTMNVYCTATGYIQGDLIHTSVDVYTIPDCLAPSQPGYVISYGNTQYENYATVTSCDTGMGYVGTPLTAQIYCNIDAKWDTAEGCTDTCDGEFHCWPGVCTGGKVAQCTCSAGYYKTPEITCQTNTYKPSFVSCYTEVNGPGGEKKSSSGSTHECQYQQDFYGNFNPTSFHYNVMAHYDPGSSYFPSQVPYYVETYKFGITDVNIQLEKRGPGDYQETMNTFYLLTDYTQSQDAADYFSKEGDLSDISVSLEDDQRICLLYHAFGGGYVKTSESSYTKVYQKTEYSRLICYYRDITAPQHCNETAQYSQCNSAPDPLILSTRISRTPNIEVTWQGWIDPAYDAAGTPVIKSGMDTYQVYVNEMLVSNSVLKVDTSIFFSETVSASQDHLSLSISTTSPKLFCVTLEVKDVADNVGKARRFFLYDDSSYINSSMHNEFYFSSAASDTNYKWQTNYNDICVNWKDHFYNQFYLENNLLGEIEPDPHGFISGIYEQTNGDLPVSGTPNVHGIIKFTFSYSKNGSEFSPEIEVPNFEAQTYCATLNPHDGDTFVVKIEATDIIGNTFAENRTVHIDTSAPLIENVGLVKNGHRLLSVHHETDLSTMDLQLDAYDIHSGIKTVEWEIGESDGGTVIDNGAVSVTNIVKIDCLVTPECYCPGIGDTCELQHYSVPLHSLVSKYKHIGDHNRNYFFTVRVTNNANLVQTEHFDVLVDASSPQIGVVLEGPDGYPDIDYTSDETFLVNWHGFIEHETEIRMYRLGLAERCLTKVEMNEKNTTSEYVVFSDVSFPDNELQFNATFTGKRYVSVVALNSAMEPSEVVCSDGISRDTSPPEIRNIQLAHARWKESIYCNNNSTWLLRSDLIKVRLSIYAGCVNESRSALVDAIPIAQNEGDAIDELMHSSLSLYDSNRIIYLPNDRIDLEWNITDDISQIDDFFVAFGKSLSEMDAPELVDYMSTNRKTFFKMHHAAIGTDEEFYMFLKAVNKAGLETIIPVGPVLIDETPPRFRSIPQVRIDGDDVMIGWENDTFYDTEQTEQISRIMFQIGHDDTVLFETFEWRQELSEPCIDYSGGCFWFSLSELQKQDTDLGLLFYVIIHVYNNAGHRITLETEKFSLPSTYPPAHATVIDLDPVTYNDTNRFDDKTADVDAHLSTNRVCAMWNEFTHHEDVQLAFGIGTSEGLDDIYSFKDIETTNKHCLTSPEIPDDVIIFVSIRATCSAGSTVSSSDGVVIYNTTRLLEQLEVFDGPECIISQHLISERNYTPGETMTFIPRLAAGHVYTLRLLGENIFESDIDVERLDVYVIDITNNLGYIDIKFQPYSDIQELLLPPPTIAISSILSGQVYDCQDELSVQLSTTSLVARWKGLSDHFTYEAAAIRFDCNDNWDDTCFDYLSSFKTLNGSAVVISGLQLLVHDVYFVGVRPCLNSKCLDPKLSSGIYIESVDHNINITKSSIALTSTDCSAVTLEWEPLGWVNVSFYQWVVVTKVGTSKAHSTLFQWRTVENITFDTIQVHECVDLPVHTFKELLACVRAFSQIGQEIETCKVVSHESDFNAYKTTVYDLDARSSFWEHIKTAIQSVYVGDVIKQLHEEEIDIGTTDADVVGVVLGGKDRKIRWFLVTIPVVPDRCQRPTCRAAVTTYDGFVRFPSGSVRYNKVQYICAKAAVMEIVKETYIETLPAIKTCSNGFILDNSPPVGGELNVNDVNGYISDLGNLVVMWDGFDDSADVITLGYENKISSYNVDIGSSRLGSDIKSSAVDGNRRFYLFDDLQVSSGTTVYVSVTAYDHVGLNRTVTSHQLTVDTTPPVVGQVVSSSLKMSKWLSDQTLSVRAKDFYDDESGIEYYLASIGSSHHRMDIMAEINHTSEVLELDLEGASLRDGHTYYLGIKAVNRAGLTSGYSYLEFSVDHTPPTGGHVMDGPSHESKDIDFQTDATAIAGHWKGFMDPQSGIAYYKVGLGTEPFEFDIEPMINVGLNRDILWNSAFTPGEKYYITVEACNEAGLCRSLSSDGIVLDTSPPVPGIVTVGSSSHHETFIPHKSFIEIFWSGFEDPQSGMNNYEACIGTSPGDCDVVPMFNCLLASSHIQGGLDLPVNKVLFARVKGYNKNYQSVLKASRHFIVDTSPPVLLSKPKFKTNYTSFTSSDFQWEKSVLKADWSFSDIESPVVRHIITLKTHHEGHTPLEQLELGKETEVTLNLKGANWLHNGDTYRIIVTACNAAGLCTHAESDDLCIDSTPPHLGGFKPPLTWQNYIGVGNKIVSRVDMNWYGFYDHETGIRKFYIGIGRTYTDNKLSDGVIELDSLPGETEFNQKISLNEGLSVGDKIVASVAAENNAGLISPFARVTLIVSSLLQSAPLATASGTLEIEKHSCDIHFCNKDCTCGIVGQVCTQAETVMPCNAITETDDNSFNVSMRVFVGINNKAQDITASSSCLPAYWLVDEGISRIKRLEWTLGMKDEPYGEGIFDLSNESPWMDVGHFQHVVYCLPLNRSLLHGTEYLVYVRVWISMDTYLIYQSAPVMVDQTAPAIRKGYFIKDSNEDCVKDYDVINWVDNVTACWDSVFYEVHGKIIYFLFGFGTSPGSDDILYQRNVGLSTRFEGTELNLTAGQHYYFTVIAYNDAGLRTVLSSDGFIVDLDGPIAGIVYNTDRNKDNSVQSETDSFDISWHGFIDHESGVKGYYVALYEKADVSLIIQNFTYLFLKTSVKLTNLSLEHGKQYFGAVKAINTGGLPSNIVVSKSKLIDTTPPVAYTCENLSLIYEIETDTSDYNRVIFPADFETESVYVISGRLVGNVPDLQIELLLGQSVGTILPAEQTHDGSIRFTFSFEPGITGSHNVTLILGSLATVNLTVTLHKCSVTDKAISDEFDVTQISSDTFKARLRVMDSESGIKTTLLGFGSSPSGFQFKSLYPVDIRSDVMVSLTAPHTSPLYATAVVENFAGLRSVFHSRMIVVDHTPPVIEGVQVVAEMKYDFIDMKNKSALLKLNITLNVQDEESVIQVCFISVGTAEYRDDIQKFEAANASNGFTSDWLPAYHGGKIYANVKCVNNVEYSSVQVSDPIIVSVEEPSVKETQLRFTLQSQSSTKESESWGRSRPVQSNTTSLQLTWDGFWDSSGITGFEYRLLSNNESLIDWMKAGLKKTVSVNTTRLEDGQVYTAEVCAINMGGLRSEAVSSEILVDSRAPGLTGQQVDVIVDNSGRAITLDWQDVFVINETIQVYFDAYIGSSAGFADVKEELFMSSHTLLIPVSNTMILTDRFDVLYITINAVYSTGERATYITSYKLPF